MKNIIMILVMIPIDYCIIKFANLIDWMLRLKIKKKQENNVNIDVDRDFWEEEDN